jgi:predicted Ser/Thr protein kinase
MTTQTARCPRCGDQFPEGLEAQDFEGICPNCLAFLAMDRSSDVVPSDVPPPDPMQLAAKDPPPLKRGATFHGMELLELIGQGGMGVVYKARQIELDRVVALKVLSPRLAADPEFPRRFNREAQALATLDHANIVRIHDVGREGDLYFIVMEYADGANLRDLLVQKKLTPEQALRVVPQLCDALEYAHSRGVIHRDIKPENIILTRSGVAKIADFGLAKIVKTENVESSITQTNVVMGTADYMAPEQRDKTKAADHRADIYSLGVVFYELLTGELPVGRFDPPSRRRQVDARLDDVVLKALEKDPDRRYQRASHLGRDVDRISTTTPTTPAECPIVDLSSGKRIATSIGLRFAVHAVDCPLTVKSWDKDEIGFSVDGDYQFDGDVAMPLLQSGVETGAIRVFVPRGVDFDASVDEGSAEFHGLTGNLVVKIPDGELKVEEHDGSLRVHGGQGRVSIVNLASEYFEVRTRKGAVDLVNVELNRGRGQIETDAGDVNVVAADNCSFRYYFDTRSGTIMGFPSGQIKGGTGWLTVRTGSGSIVFTSLSFIPGIPLPRKLLDALTPRQVEKIGKYVIVNVGLFLFFFFVTGTPIPAIIVAIFWGISLGLELWKGYVRGQHREKDVPPALQKVFQFVPTPAPEAPPPPVTPKTSALAVLGLMISISAFLTAVGSSICILVESGVKLSIWNVHELYVGAFLSAVTAVLLAVPGLLMGMTASALVPEGRGAIRGKGAAHAAIFLSLIAAALPLMHVKPRLVEIDRRMAEARGVSEQMLEDLRSGRIAEARAAFAEPLQARFSEAELKGRVDRGLKNSPQVWKTLRPRRTRLAGSQARVEFQPFGLAEGVVLEHDGRWKVTEIKPLLDRLGD